MPKRAAVALTFAEFEENGMDDGFVRCMAFALSLGCAGVAGAQSMQTLRGEIEALDGTTLRLKSASGQETAISVPENTRVSVRAPATIDAIKPGEFIGTAAKPGPDGTLVASEVHIFPEAMRGTGEGHRPMANLPGSTMTNATVAGVSSSASRGTMTNATVDKVGQTGMGRTLKLKYKAGEQTVFVPQDAPVVTVEDGSRASLAPGEHVIVYARRNAGGELAAQRISVGKNRSVPPI
jgi:hypothetical protein